jgi:ADP-ribose pyrophosphatase YjhB (NUDIX family)
MTFDIERYRRGYSIGAGAVVLCGDKILLVRLGYGSSRELWSLPGGYVEPEETISITVTREVLEETGVSAEVEGLIGVRSRVFSAENSLYLIFLLRATTDEARPDGAEVLEACFFSLPEAQALPDLTPMTRLIVARAAKGELRLLQAVQVPSYATNEFILFM